jgi:hypothetical protein
MLSGKLEVKIGWIIRLINKVKLVWKFKEHCECEYSVCGIQYQTVTMRNSGLCILPLPVCNAQCKWRTARPHIPPCFLLSVLSLLIANMNVIKLRHIKKSIQSLQLCSLKVSFLHAESWCSFRDQNLLCKKTRHNADIVL